MLAKLIAAVLVFAIGLGAGIYAADVYAQDNAWRDGISGDSALLSDAVQTQVTAPFQTVTTQASPADRVPERAIGVYRDRVVLDVKNVQWATFTDTHSMEPVLAAGANALEIVPQTEDEVHVGDIVSYRSEYAEGFIIHRVVYKGQDEQGTYFVMKGDNLPTSDPGKIRFRQVQRVVIGIIY
jgi:hypothetical protein